MKRAMAVPTRFAEWQWSRLFHRTYPMGRRREPKQPRLSRAAAETQLRGSRHRPFPASAGGKAIAAGRERVRR